MQIKELINGLEYELENIKTLQKMLIIVECNDEEYEILQQQIEKQVNNKVEKIHSLVKEYNKQDLKKIGEVFEQKLGYVIVEVNDDKLYLQHFDYTPSEMENHIQRLLPKICHECEYSEWKNDVGETIFEIRRK